LPFTVSEILATQDRTVRIAHADGGGFRLANDDEDALITATYRVGAITPRFQEEMAARRAAAGPEDTSWVISLLIPMIASWDVETDEHQPYPITEEALRDMPYALLGGVMDCINRDAEIPKASSSTSSVGSVRPKKARGGSGARSRTGTTRSSASPAQRAS
jgi:hypothetical protein